MATHPRPGERCQRESRRRRECSSPVRSAGSHAVCPCGRERIPRGRIWRLNSDPEAHRFDDLPFVCSGRLWSGDAVHRRPRVQGGASTSVDQIKPRQKEERWRFEKEAKGKRKREKERRAQNVGVRGRLSMRRCLWCNREGEGDNRHRRASELGLTVDQETCSAPSGWRCLLTGGACSPSSIRRSSDLRCCRARSCLTDRRRRDALLIARSPSAHVRSAAVRTRCWIVRRRGRS